MQNNISFQESNVEFFLYKKITLRNEIFIENSKKPTSINSIRYPKKGKEKKLVKSSTGANKLDEIQESPICFMGF
jgi:hypothetical protein